MTKHRDFNINDPLPSAYMDARQEFTGSYLSPNFRVTALGDGTGVQVVASTGNDQVAAAIGGSMRFNTSTVTAANPGTQGTHTVYITTRVLNTAQEDGGTFNYTFGLKTSTPSGTGEEALSRPVATLVTGSDLKVVSIKNLAETDSVAEGGTGVATFTAGVLYSPGATVALGSRVLAGTTGEITVTNGDGVAGAPTFSLPATLSTNKTVSGTWTFSTAPTFSVSPTFTAGINIPSGQTYQINSVQISSGALSDGSNLAHINAGETISAAWTFSTAPSLGGATATTQSQGTNNTTVATTAFVVAAVAAVTGGTGGIAYLGNDPQSFTGANTFSKTGTALTVTNGASIGTLTLTNALAAGSGGTGNAFTAFSGPATSVKTFTLPNATATILTDNADVTVAQGGTGVGTFTAGFVYGNGTAALATRTIQGTTGQITVTNSDGTAGNPTISLPASITQATTFTAGLTADGGLTMGDADNIAVGTTTGTKIGTATTQKLGFFNSAPITPPASPTQVALDVATNGAAGVPTALTSASTLNDVIAVVSRLHNTLQTYGLVGSGGTWAT